MARVGASGEFGSPPKLGALSGSVRGGSAKIGRGSSEFGRPPKLGTLKGGKGKRGRSGGRGGEGRGSARGAAR